MVGAARRGRGGGAARRWQRASSAGSRSHQNIQISREKITGGRLAKFESTSQESHALRGPFPSVLKCVVSAGGCVPLVSLRRDAAPPRRRCQLGQDATCAHRICRAHSRGLSTDRSRCCTRHPPSGIVSSSMEAVYPAAASALARGRRARRADVRARHRTTPVTFAEIKEVDEENEDEACATAPPSRGSGSGSGSGERRRPDVLDERLGRQFLEFRRRRRRDALPEPPDEPAEPGTGSAAADAAPRAGSEPLEPR